MPSGIIWPACQNRHPVISARLDECREALEPVAAAFDQSNSEAAQPSASRIFPFNKWLSFSC
jgi:hypothetical protein